MSSAGYPKEYKTGSVIKGLEEAIIENDTMIFHAGTKFKDKEIVSAGGRVLGVSALGSTLEIAQSRAYKTLKTIEWPQGYYRKDICWRAIKRD